MKKSKPKFSFMVGVGQNTTGPKKGAPPLPEPDKLPKPSTQVEGADTTEKFVPNRPRE